MAHPYGVEDHSEFEGGGVMPNTVFPMGTEALTPSDKLRLQSLTGQDTDSRAPVNPYHWRGSSRSKNTDLEEIQRSNRTRRSDIARVARDRYRESPY